MCMRVCVCVCVCVRARISTHFSVVILLHIRKIQVVYSAFYSSGSPDLSTGTHFIISSVALG
jgi:hypothetical protein